MWQSQFIKVSQLSKVCIKFVSVGSLFYRGFRVTLHSPSVTTDLVITNTARTTLTRTGFFTPLAKTGPVTTAKVLRQQPLLAQVSLAIALTGLCYQDPRDENPS